MESKTNLQLLGLILMGFLVGMIVCLNLISAAGSDDYIEPSITLNYPEDGYTTDQHNLDFSFTVNNFNSEVNCSMTFDSMIYHNDWHIDLGTIYSNEFTFNYNLTYEWLNQAWIIDCIDNDGNSASSEIRHLNVNWYDIPEVCPIVEPTICPTLSCPSQSCSGGTNTIYKNNTLVEYKYLTSTPINEPCEVVCSNTTEYIDKVIETSKPFYKSLWFYSTIILVIVLLIGIFYGRK